MISDWYRSVQITLHWSLQETTASSDAANAYLLLISICLTTCTDCQTCGCCCGWPLHFIDGYAHGKNFVSTAVRHGNAQVGYSQHLQGIRENHSV